jgi:hypothetical protein
MSEETSEQGSLERLGIKLETQPKDGVLTPGTVKSARFRMSKPSGYAVKDVEDFVLNIVQPSLTWYAQALHQRDLDVHQLGKELDLIEVDNLNLKFQLQAAQFGSQVQEGLDMNKDDKEMQELLQRYTALEAQLEAATTENAQLKTYTAAQDEYIDQILAQVSGTPVPPETNESPEVEAEYDVPMEPEVSLVPEEIIPVYEEPEAPVAVYHAEEEEEIPLDIVEEHPTIQEDTSDDASPADQRPYSPIYGVLPKGINPEDL